MVKFPILLIPAFLLLSSCATGPLRYDQQPEGQWQAKALIRNKKEGKSAVVGLDINAVQLQKLRMDVTAALGHPLASVVMDGDHLTYVLMESKQYYQGQASDSSLKPLLALQINPRLLYNVLFDLPIEDKSWTCTKDSSGFLSECKNLGEQTLIRWSERKGRRKLVRLENSTGMVQINVSGFQPKVEDRAQLFTLKPPKSFKPIRL